MYGIVFAGLKNNGYVVVPVCSSTMKLKEVYERRGYRVIAVEQYMTVYEARSGAYLTEVHPVLIFLDPNRCEYAKEAYENFTYYPRHEDEAFYDYWKGWKCIVSSYDEIQETTWCHVIRQNA